MDQIGKLANDIANGEKRPFELPVPQFVDIREIDLKKHFGLVSLDDFVFEHMTPEQRTEMNAVITAVRGWREHVREYGTGVFILLGDAGRGKTMIAQAVHDSFSFLPYGTELIDLTDRKQLALERESVFYIANELMETIADREFRLPPKIKCVVIDEIGREGEIKFEKRDIEYQQRTIQNYYFRVINSCVNRCALFITSNLTAQQFKSFFNEATYSRLMGMCLPGHMYEMVKVPDYRLVQSGRNKK